jgi:hypothetical protein
MADQEIIKHTKKVITLWGDAEATFWHKLKDFAVEILIIVFAVTISIWLHNWSEHANEQKVTRTFLLGLKDDLRADIFDVNDELDTYKRFDLLYTFLGNLDQARGFNKDSLHLALTYIGSNTFLRAHKSRFDGFLSAGKIMTIENDSLAQSILEYYEETLPALHTSEQGWISENEVLNNYLINNVRDMGSDSSKFQVLATPKGKYLTKSLIPWPQLLERCHSVITEANKIVARISMMYPKSK